MNAQPDRPPGYARWSKAARRVYDALDRENGSLSRKALEDRTHHAERTVREALQELRDQDVVKQRSSWPVPKYDLAE